MQLAYNIANNISSINRLNQEGFRSIDPQYIRDTFDLIEHSRDTNQEESISSSLYPMISHNLRAYEPIHASNGNQLYEFENEQRAMDEDDDDDDDDEARGGDE